VDLDEQSRIKHGMDKEEWEEFKQEVTLDSTLLIFSAK
jgi:hypothetical protein